MGNADTAVDHSKWEMHDAVSHTGTGMSSSLLLPENGQLELEVLAVNIPSDQMRMIQNINALISEVAFVLMLVNYFILIIIV